ncbi:glycosyl transferase [Nordella sp. HKS 07]|uniref:glycosyltransferase family protein n=1 Tax=Nordella sp. HKS 07 TaxID=2712222 RepID=UPI0013E1FD43|nr:glycosyltransferase [Nordella sp. HKS 07]QIG47660.1 glycosyl transferase [Nordella sp. HKS 07]
MKVLIYVQHLLGIGHLARVSRISAALARAGDDVTLLSGGAPVSGFPPSGVRLVQLPPIRARDMSFSALIDDDGNEIDDAFKAARRDRLIAEFDAIRPDALVIEAFPFGRRQMRFELLPLLRHARAAKRPPLIASSVRDILQENRKAGRAEETLGVLRDYFDLVLVHGDPAFARLDETFPEAGEIAERIAYTGLVAGEAAISADRFDVVVSAGGGVVGRKLIETAIAVAPQFLGRWPSWCIITGPNFPAAEKQELTARLPRGVALETFRSDFPGLLARASLSISQAGYNTVCDILRAQCPAILIPFAAGGETEQTDRARRLEALELAAMLREDMLTPESLSRTIATMPQRSAVVLNLDGAAETARILRRHVAEP